MTPELEGRECLTAALTSSYAAAVQLAAKWGSAVDDETIRTHVRQVGQRIGARPQRTPVWNGWLGAKSKGR